MSPHHYGTTRSPEDPKPSKGMYHKGHDKSPESEYILRSLSLMLLSKVGCDTSEANGILHTGELKPLARLAT